MFLLKRKSDGRFFRNRGYHQDSSWRSANKGPDDPRWIADPSQCVPFASVVGLKNSRGVTLGMPSKRPSYEDRVAYEKFLVAHREWYSKTNAKARRVWELEKFNEKYEIVEVSYTVVK